MPRSSGSGSGSHRPSFLPAPGGAKRALSNVRWDFGVRSLLPEWRAMLSREHLREDVVAGLTVACVALPLSLAIALASDVPPAVGLTTAIVAGISCALLGGTRLAVSGPAAAMAVLIGQIVDAHGLGGLLVVGLGCGVLQLATGLLGLGRLARLIPLSVVHGFTAGIGVLILVGQLPRALGLPSPDESHVLDVVPHVFEYATHARPWALAISIPVVLVTLLVPRRWPKVPAALVAVAVPTLMAAWLELDVPRIGEIPRALPMPSFPSIPTSGLAPLLADAFVVFAIASLETLLSSSAVDKLSGPGSPPHDPDQELVGQGVGNLAVALFGGIPVTGVIARSGLNVLAGARTRRSAIIHALALIACVYVAAPLVSQIPIAALAGVLLATGLRMLEPKYLRELWRASPIEAAVFVITCVSIVFTNLLAGVQVGVVAALLVALLRLSRTSSALHPGHEAVPHQLSFSGPLTFLSTGRLEETRAELAGLDRSRPLVLDLRHVDSVDATAGTLIVDMATGWKERGGRVALLGPNGDVERRLLALSEGRGVERLIGHFEADLDRILERDRDENAESAHRRLVAGADRFRADARQRLSPLLDRFADGQQPHTLFLTCSDSRIVLGMLTGTTPGELFVVRNIGALIPPCGHPTLNDEGAALEYAVRVLGVRNLVVCGHSKCGAMTALREGNLPPDLLALAQWAKGASEIAGDLRAAPTLDDATRACSVRQLEHLRSYPVVRDALAKGELKLSAWFYDVDKADVLEWDPELREYRPLVARGEPVQGAA
jgi:carbonic anhydrase